MCQKWASLLNFQTGQVKSISAMFNIAIFWALGWVMGQENIIPANFPVS